MKLLSQVREIKYFIYNVITGISNIISYIPIIYRDRDWDESWFLRLMVFKLGRMQKLFERSDIHPRNPQIAKKIMIIKTLLKRIEEDNYCEAEYDDLTKKWGDYTWDHKSPRGSCISRENIKTIEDEKQHDKEFRYICKKAEQMEKHEFDLALKLIRKHLKTFWD